MLALRMLNTSIRRHIENSQTKQELDHIVGVNGWIIGYLAEHESEEIYQRDLERDLCICRSAVSKIVAALEKSGLIERERVASDDRLKKLVLTERGRQYTEQIRTENLAIEQQITDGFSPEELAALHQYLKKMQQNLVNS